MVGAIPNRKGTFFRLWAPKAEKVDLEVEKFGGTSFYIPLTKNSGGYFTDIIPDIGTGDLYRFRINGLHSIPDPASRFQPQGVHGPSQIVDLLDYKFQHEDWKGVPLEKLIIYEIHVGAFTREGTFKSAAEKLPFLKKLGVTAVELMPVADFPGRWNWGYDGVSAFAPSRSYGTPRALQAFVDAAHGHGMAVLLDVVYNHFGPDGNYLGVTSDFYTTKKHQTIWGEAFNMDGPESGPVREFFIQNAIYWLQNYRIDGLRLDATHAIIDNSRRHFLSELSDRCKSAIPNRRVLLIAENEHKDRLIVTPTSERGWGMDAVWADDFHHHLRRRLAGDKDGYFKPYSGSTADIVKTMQSGWFLGADAGRSEGVKPSRFVFCLQNHDQVGNRAFGERLHHQIDPAAYRAASTLLLLSPHTPLLFMGQEWAAASPFLYFTDHEKKLGEKVVEGRRAEFKNFKQFGEDGWKKIPSPQAASTFAISKLNWEERAKPEHATVFNLYAALISLRKEKLQVEDAENETFDAQGGGSIIRMRRKTVNKAEMDVIVNLDGAASTTLPKGKRHLVFSTEDKAYAIDPSPPVVKETTDGLKIEFNRPGALVFLSRDKGQAKRP